MRATTTLKIHPSFREFLFCLLDHEVKFMVAGAYVLASLGRSRYTDDIDIFVEPTKANAQRLARALLAFGYAELGKQAAVHFAVEERMATLGVPPVAIDILSSLTGLPFRDAWKTRRLVRIDDRDVPFLSRDSFVQTKRATGRTKDKLDLALLDELDTRMPTQLTLKKPKKRP